MPKEDLSNLPPEERIKRLKELEKKRKQEIEEAQKEIKESQEEIKERQKWLEKVPMPEFAQDTLEGLSEEAKQILKERGVKEKKKDINVEGSEDDKPTATPRPPSPGLTVEEGVESLEETLARERAELPPEAREVEYGIAQTSQQPMQEIYQELTNIRDEAEEKGYVTREKVGRAEYLGQAIEKKFAAAEGGNYPSFTEEVAEKGILSQEIVSKVKGLYKGGQGDNYQR